MPESSYILLFNQDNPSLNQVRGLLESINLRHKLWLVTTLDESLNAPYAFDVILVLSTGDNQAQIDLIEQLHSNYPEAGLIYLTENQSITVARHCLTLDNGHVLGMEQIALLPDLLGQILSKKTKSKQSIKRLKAQQQTILKLASNPGLMTGDKKETFHEITQASSQTLAVSRVSIWSYNEQKTSIICDMLYDERSKRFETGLELTAGDYPAYFKALHENRVIVAHDAHQNSATCEFSGGYLEANDIYSILDAPIRVQGKMIGVVCHEQTGSQHHWTYDDQQFASAIADLVALSIENRERRRAEEALRKREQYLKEAEALAHVGNFEVNLIEQTITWSNEVHRIFGREIGSSVTWELYESLLRPEDYRRVIATVETAVAEQKTREFEHDLVFEDGRIKNLFAIIRPIVEKDGTVKKIFGIVQDITGRKNAEQQEMELQLNQQKISFLQDFIDSMTHDIKTPLSSMQSSIYLLKHIEDRVKQDTHLESMKQQVKRIQNIIDDILTISRLEHLPDLNFQQQDLNILIQDVVSQVQAQANKKQIQLSLELGDTPLDTRMDYDEMQRVLLNLTENAINYTLEQGIVTIRTYRNTSHILCEIQDTGIGIRDDDLEQIFNRFYRADNARSFTTGTGLGLAIVKKIIDLHAGHIQVESSPEQGTLMRIQLP